MLMRCSIPMISLSVLSSIAIAEPSNWAYVLDEQLNTVTMRIDEAGTTQGVIGTDRSGLQIRFTPEQIRALWIDNDMVFREGFDAELYEQALSVELTDGQRVVMLIEPTNDEDIVQGKRLESDQLVSIPIERIRSIGKKDAVRDFTSATSFFEHGIEDDAIRLNNQDVVLGYIVSIGQSIQIETTSPDGQAISRNYPVDQVHAVMLQNPIEPSPGMYVLTTLNERLRVRDYQWSVSRGMDAMLDDPMHTRSESQSFNAELLGVDTITDDAGLINLQTYSPAVIEPTGGRQWAPTPIVRTSRWLGSSRSRARIESPISMTWNLPQGSTRMTMEVNAWNQRWTDNTVIITATDLQGTVHTLWTKHFDSTPTQYETLNLELPRNAESLRFEIDPAMNGPIQDKFFLQLPLILVEPSSELQ
jgi:hypothetical protein